MRGYVALLHGLGRSSASMTYAEYRVRRAGLTPVNIAYPSRREPLEALARHVAERLPADASLPLHFLTHSMGGIVLRLLARSYRPGNLGRAVMLGPPNQGSQLASGIRNTWISRWFLGPAAQEIGHLPGSVPNQIGPVDFEVGVIAGRSSFDPLRIFVAGESDGRVSLQETKVEGMTDWISVKRSHALLMVDPSVFDQALHFIEHGGFRRPSGAADRNQPGER